MNDKDRAEQLNTNKDQVRSRDKIKDRRERMSSIAFDLFQMKTNQWNFLGLHWKYLSPAFLISAVQCVFLTSSY